MRGMLQERGYAATWQVGSAGTWTVNGEPASWYGQAAMEEQGCDTRGHRSRMITRKMLAEADLAVVMAGNHREALLAEFPEFRAQLHLLSHLAGQVGDVWDPIGGTLDDYRETASTIAELLALAFPRIVQLVEQGGARS